MLSYETDIQILEGLRLSSRFHEPRLYADWRRPASDQ